MRWQMMKAGAPIQDAELFDDGIVGAHPGDEDFTSELAAAEAQRIGADGFNYVGTSSAAPE